MKFEILNPIKWKKSVLAVLLTAFVLFWFGFIDTYSLSTRWELRSRKGDLKERTVQLQKDTELLSQKINSLNKNAALLEKIAREEYGMRKPGETVYKIHRKD